MFSAFSWASGDPPFQLPATMLFRCKWFTWRRQGRTASVDKEMQAPLSESKRSGKQKAGKPTYHTLKFRRAVDWSGPAPEFAAIGAATCASTNRVIWVAPNSAAAKCGLKPFDLILELRAPVDQTKTASSNRVESVEIKGKTLDESCRYVREGRLKIERPPREIWPTLLEAVVEANGVTEEWINALLATATGDEPGAIAMVQRLMERHGTGVLARRASALDAQLVRLAALAIACDIDPMLQLTDASLVELALDGGARELANHLLLMASEESGGGSRPAAAAGAAAASAACGSGCSSSYIQQRM